MALTIVWMRRDLRLSDNPALVHAVARGEVLPVYIFAPEEEAPWQPGAAGRWWLHHSLTALERDIADGGGNLIIRRGPTAATLMQLITESGADAVVWNRLFEPAALRQENIVSAQLQRQGIHHRGFNGNLLIEPASILNRSRLPYRVFTPFWNACLKCGFPRDRMHTPPNLKYTARLSSNSVADLNLLPRVPWDEGFYSHWQPGEQGAQAKLAEFIRTSLSHYSANRDFPARDATSRLSPHLHFGEVSPRQMLAAVEEMQIQERRPGLSRAAEHFLRELGWREFAHYILYHFPHTAELPFDPRFRNFPWHRDERMLERWQRGMTGYPIIDAGMRELWQTGTVHNRVRMIVASFLTKNCGLHWLDGARWFWDTLVDADLANNSLNWQWVAGCGADAAPYFRIFNPVTQGQKFDPEGHYIKRWLPELSGLNAAQIHTPWKENAPHYYPPLLDLGESRRDALSKYQDFIRNRADRPATAL